MSETEQPVPDPSLIRGMCPQCGAALVSNVSYIVNEATGAGRGYLIQWICWQMCGYRKVL